MLVRAEDSTVGTHSRPRGWRERLDPNLVLVAGLFALITGMRVAVDSASEGIVALYSLPIAVAAINWSRRAAVLSGVVAYALFVALNLLLEFDIGPVGYITRALLFAGVGLIVHEYAARAKRAEDFTVSVLHSIGEGVGVADAKGRLVFFNRENERIVGLPPGTEIPPEEWSEHFRITDPRTGEPIPTEDLPMVRALGGERVQGAPLLITPEGQEPRYAVANADPVVGRDGERLGAVVSLRDETERLRAEEARRELAAIVESSEDAISTAALDGTIDTWNAGAERLFGYTAEEAIGRPMATLLPPELREGGERILRRIAGGERIDSFEFDIVRKDGRRVPVSLTAAPIFDAEGRITKAASIIRDVSERRRAEAEAEEMKSQFFALVSHELRTPLTSILGYSDLINEDDEAGELPQTGRRYLEIIRRNSERLDRLVQDLLLVAQVEAGRFSVQIGEVEIGEVARDCVDQTRPAAEEKGLALVLEAEPVAPFAGDATRLSQVLDNLVSNAIKFTPAGGRVTLRVREESGRCALEVADTGAGIEPDELEHLFDRFYRASAASKNYIKGVGLGLAITKAIVEQHDGEIEIESEPGRGSTFRVMIPMTQPQGSGGGNEREERSVS